MRWCRISRSRGRPMRALPWPRRRSESPCGRPFGSGAAPGRCRRSLCAPHWCDWPGLILRRSARSTPHRAGCPCWRRARDSLPGRAVGRRLADQLQSPRTRGRAPADQGRARNLRTRMAFGAPSPPCAQVEDVAEPTGRPMPTRKGHLIARSRHRFLDKNPSQAQQ